MNSSQSCTLSSMESIYFFNYIHTSNTTNCNRDLQKHIYQRMMGTTTWLFPCTIGVDSTDGGGAFSSTGGNSVEEL